MALRSWQKNGIRVYQGTRSDILIEACVGAGKTVIAAHVARIALDESEASFVIAIVPTVTLKDSFRDKFAAVCDLQFTTALKAGYGKPIEYQGAAITYAQLPNMIATFETWVANGERLLFIFDEIHHCSSGEHANEWGSAAEAARRVAVRAVSMTGTPFRSDGRRISFVRYNEHGDAVPDIRYTYDQAVAANVCREVTFHHDDGVTQYAANGVIQEQRISETLKVDRGNVSRVAFGASDTQKSEFLETLIAKADAQLDDIRLTHHNAGCLVICRPGRDEAATDAHVDKVAKLIESVTGEEVTVVTHRDKDASAKIAAFTSGKSKYIVAVRMISEGIDIPRLRVLLMANVTGSEMLFRQMVGRVVRQTPDADPEIAHVYMAKMPPMTDFASRMRKEAEAGLNEREKKPRERDGDGPSDRKSSFVALGATHEHGGVTSHEQVFTAQQVAEAEAIRASNPALRHTPLHLILHIRSASAPAPAQVSTAPRQVRVKGQRAELARRMRQLAAIRGGGDAFASVGVALWKLVGVRNMDDLCDNHPEEKLARAIETVRGWISEETRRAS